MVVSEDIQFQQRGVVTVVYAVGRSGFDFDAAWKQASLSKALPLRLEAMHICQDSFFIHSLASTFTLSTNLFTSVRIRTHYGTFCCRREHFPA